MTAQNVAASMSGCAGQRCMAASAMVGVGPVDHIIQKICEEARRIIPGKNLGAVINKESKDRIERYITEAEQQGAKILVDGRNASVDGKENGTYVGPTVIDFVKPGMAVATEEIFGPVISIMRVDTLDQALEIENASPYGNAASVFTPKWRLRPLCDRSRQRRYGRRKRRRPRTPANRLASAAGTKASSEWATSPERARSNSGPS